MFDLVEMAVYLVGRYFVVVLEPAVDHCLQRYHQLRAVRRIGRYQMQALANR